VCSNYNFVLGGSIVIKVHNEIGKYVHTKKGLRQDDLLSPMLFNLVVDMLAIIIERVVDGRIVGVIVHLIDGGLSILQYMILILCGTRF
jgi:hypothetical protein